MGKVLKAFVALDSYLIFLVLFQSSLISNHISLSSLEQEITLLSFFFLLIVYGIYDLNFEVKIENGVKH